MIEKFKHWKAVVIIGFLVALVFIVRFICSTIAKNKNKQLIELTIGHLEQQIQDARKAIAESQKRQKAIHDKYRRITPK